MRVIGLKKSGLEQIPSIDSFGDGQTRNEQSVQNMQLGDMDGYSRGGASLFVHENERTGLYEEEKFF